LLRFSRRPEERAVVVSQHLHVMLNVSRVAQLGFDAEMGAQEGRREFGNLS